jgi:tetraacyldisaccharide 4'-kinase
MRDALQQAWLIRGWTACLLWPISKVYGFATGVRRLLYRSGLLASAHVGAPVLIVGNVIAGGAGKTPLVIAVVHHFQCRGVRVGVLSRGYGRRSHGCLQVLAETPVFESGDEAALIRRATGAPVFIASKRVHAALALLDAYPETQLLVCDDGLQHYALRRDIEIAVFDDRGLGNGWLLPAGPLREPWPERSRQGADLVLHSGNSPAFEGYSASRQLADHAIALDGSKIPLASLRGAPVAALAAIASPGAFFAMLRSEGLTIEQTISLPDHYDFAGYRLPAKSCNTVLCTEKDAVKLFGLSSMAQVRLLAVPLRFTAEPAFFAALDALVAPLLSQLPSGNGHKTA